LLPTTAVSLRLLALKPRGTASRLPIRCTRV